jgi:hypothetical protein
VQVASEAIPHATEATTTEASWAAVGVWLTSEPRGVRVRLPHPLPGREALPGRLALIDVVTGKALPGTATSKDGDRDG